MNEIKITPADSLTEILSGVSPGTRVMLSPGTYREKVGICVPDIELVGSSAEDTRIVWDDYARKLDERGSEYITFRSYTAAVMAPRVTMRGITVENEARSPETKGQEIALSVCADGFLAEDCRFISTQDTLFCGPLPPDLITRYDGFLDHRLCAGGAMRQIFRSCLIAGSVDFIFGCGDALFEGCEIRSLRDARGHGYAAAPAHPAERETGFVFDGCRFTCEEGVADGSVFLARPWRDFGKCSFIDCEYGSHISPGGFDGWGASGRDRTARFAEYGNGSAGRVPWSRILNMEEKNILLSRFI